MKNKSKMDKELIIKWHEKVISKYPEYIQRELRIARTKFLR